MKSKATARYLGALSISILSVQTFASSGHEHWGYGGHSGPEHWGELKQAFSVCKTGTRQSPIDISVKQLLPAKLGDIRFDYQPASPELINNGHTIQVNYADGSVIAVGGRQFGRRSFISTPPAKTPSTVKLMTWKCI